MMDGLVHRLMVLEMLKKEMHMIIYTLVLMIWDRPNGKDEWFQQ